MQGDLSFGEILYQPVDDQRTRCSLCQRVIYKLLQKGHTLSHGAIHKAMAGDKPVSKGIKKFSLQFELPTMEPLKKATIERSESLLDFEQILKSPLDLPQKHKSGIVTKNCEKKVKSNYGLYIKHSISCRNSLSRACFAYERCCYAFILRGWKRWKRVISH